MANNFLVSVAKAIGRDANTGTGIFLGKANISSAFTMSTSAQEVRGGVGNPLLYIFYHSRKVEIKVESATFDKSFLGLNAGALVQNSSLTAVASECITLVGGIGTVTNTPTSDVCVFMPDGTIQTVTPVGKTITVVGGGALSPEVVYNYTATLDNITVSTSTPPSVVDLTLVAEVRDNTGVIVNYLVISIPRFQISGNYQLSLAANGVSTQALEGMALEVASSDCTSGAYFAKIMYVPPVSTSTTTASIVAIPSTLTFVLSGGAQSLTTKVLGIRGTSTADVTTSCSFVVNPAASGSFAAGLHTGIVTISASCAALAASTGSMVVTYWDTVGSGSRTDWVNLGVA